MSDSTPTTSTTDHPPVLTKADFARRYMAGEFGNRAPSWDTLDDYCRSNYRGGLIHVRNRVAGGSTWYNVRPEDVVATWDLAISKGYTAEQLYLSAMAPTELTTLQGEVWRTVGGLELTYSTVKKPMRNALAESQLHTVGITANALLFDHMNDYSYDWLRTLLDRYPDHVVEFSCYGRDWGTVPGHNTVFWEVRAY